MDPNNGKAPADLNGKSPAEPSNGKAPTDPINGKAPVDPKNGKAPADPKNGKAPADPKNGKAPVDPKNGEAPVDPKDGKAPVDPKSGKAPADPKNGKAPADPTNGKAPADQKNGKAPVDPKNGEAPGSEPLALNSQIIDILDDQTPQTKDDASLPQPSGKTGASEANPVVEVPSGPGSQGKTKKKSHIDYGPLPPTPHGSGAGIAKAEVVPEEGVPPPPAAGKPDPAADQPGSGKPVLVSGADYGLSETGLPDQPSLTAGGQPKGPGQPPEAGGRTVEEGGGNPPKSRGGGNLEPTQTMTLIRTAKTNISQAGNNSNSSSTNNGEEVVEVSEVVVFEPGPLAPSAVVADDSSNKKNNVQPAAGHIQLAEAGTDYAANNQRLTSAISSLGTFTTQSPPGNVVITTSTTTPASLVRVGKSFIAATASTRGLPPYITPPARKRGRPGPLRSYTIVLENEGKKIIRVAGGSLEEEEVDEKSTKMRPGGQKVGAGRIETGSSHDDDDNDDGSHRVSVLAHSFSRSRTKPPPGMGIMATNQPTNQDYFIKGSVS